MQIHFSILGRASGTKTKKTTSKKEDKKTKTVIVNDHFETILKEFNFVMSGSISRAPTEAKQTPWQENSRVNDVKLPINILKAVTTETETNPR